MAVKNKQVIFMCEEALLRRLDLALSYDESRSAFIRRSIVERLERLAEARKAEDPRPTDP